MLGEFERLFLEAVDEGLSSLGETVKHVTYYHIEKTYGLKREDLLDPRRLEEALDGIYRAGSYVLKKLIIDRLYDKLRLPNPKSTSFIGSLEEARRRFEMQSQIRSRIYMKKGK